MTVPEILDAFPSQSALVVGDVCLDFWCTYDPAAGEPSRETGIARIGVVGSECTPGAAGTVANNLAALGTGKVAVLGVIGEDGFGFELSRALEARGIDSSLMIRSNSVRTFTYTKLINCETGVEDKGRVDYINTRPLASPVEAELIARVRAAVEGYNIVIISDQAETSCGGVITPAVRDELSALALAHKNKVFWADSRLRAEHFRNMIVKPNQREASEACRRLFQAVDYGRLREAVRAPALFVTKGSEGAAVVDDSGEALVPAVPEENPVDICGAGDSFSAGAAVALAITGSPLEAARFGNLVASITIMKKGTGTASPGEVRARDQALP